MKNMSPQVAMAALAALNAEDESRTEIIRVRVKPTQKLAIAKRAASFGLPTATHAYNLLTGDAQAHGKHFPAARTGAARRPVAPRPVNNRRHL